MTPVKQDNDLSSQVKVADNSYNARNAYEANTLTNQLQNPSNANKFRSPFGISENIDRQNVQSKYHGNTNFSHSDGTIGDIASNQSLEALSISAESTLENHSLSLLSDSISQDTVIMTTSAKNATLGDPSAILVDTTTSMDAINTATSVNLSNAVISIDDQASESNGAMASNESTRIENLNQSKKEDNENISETNSVSYSSNQSLPNLFGSELSIGTFDSTNSNSQIWQQNNFDTRNSSEANLKFNERD